MNHKIRLLKRVISFAIFVLFSFNSFAAVVSDNDGSAFITKAEFDNLKNSFQSQIDTYYTSIDTKIDGAIAAYLAGIKLANTREGYLNILSQTQKFGTSFTLPTPNLGDKLEGYFNVGYFKTAASGTSKCTQLQHLTGVVNAPAWKDFGANYGQYLVGDYYDDDTNPTLFVLKNTAKTSYSAILTGLMTSGAGNPSGAWPGDNDVSNHFVKGDIKAVGSYSDMYKINLADITQIAVTKGWSFEDEIDDVDTNVLSGTAIDGTTNYYFVKSTELSNLGDSIVNYLKPNFFGREVQADGHGWTTCTSTAYKCIYDNYLEIYSHKYKSIKLTQLINQTASSLIQENVKLYNGLPVYSPTTSGENVTIDFVFNNSASGYTYFVVQKGPFDNTSISTSYTSTVALGNTLRAANNQTIRFNISGLEPTDTIWIKARPASGTTTIKTENILVQ